MQRQSLVIGLVLLSLPCALALGQQSVCAKGDSVEVFVDRKWWPGRVMDVPRNNECAVSHRAYFGTDNTSWVEFTKVRARGSGPVATPAPATPATVRSAPAPAPSPVPAPTRPARVEPVAPVAAPAVPNGPSREVGSGPYVLVDGYGNLRYRTFFPGGFIYSGTPTAGSDLFTLTQARAGDPRDLGSYTLRGSALLIAWGGGAAPESKTFATKGADVVLDGYTYRRLARYPSGKRLDGRYATRVFNSSGVAGGGAMTWSGAATIIFHSNGTFEYASGGSASTTAGNGAAGSGSARTNGRYAIAGNTITFTFADGTTQRALIHPWSGEESDPRPSSVNIGGHTYTRETR